MSNDGFGQSKTVWSGTGVQVGWKNAARVLVSKVNAPFLAVLFGALSPEARATATASSIQLEPLASLQLPSGVRDVAIVGSKAVVIGDTGFSFIDLSDPANPILLGSTNNPALGGSRIAVRDGFGFCTTRTGFSVVDLPGLLGAKPLYSTNFVDGRFTTIGGVTLVDNMAVVASTAGGIRLFDVTNPGTPMIRFEAMGLTGGSPFTVGGSGNSFAVHGSHVYSGFTPPSTSRPGSDYLVSAHRLDSRGMDLNYPKLIYSLRSARIFWDLARSGEALEMAVMGDHLLVATAEVGLKVLSINQGTNLFEVASLPLVPTNLTMQLAAQGSTVFVLHSAKRIDVLKLSDPAQPEFAGFHTNLLGLRRIQPFGSNLLALDDSDSLVVFRLGEVPVQRRSQTIRLASELPARVHACWATLGTNDTQGSFIGNPKLSLVSSCDSGLPVQWSIVESVSDPDGTLNSEIQFSWNSTNLTVWPVRWNRFSSPNHLERIYDAHERGNRLRVRLAAVVPGTPDFEAATLEREIEFDFSPRLEIRGLERSQGGVGPVDVAQVRVPDFLVRARQDIPPPWSPVPRMTFVPAAGRFQVQYSTNLVDWTLLAPIYPTGAGVVSVPLPVDAAAANLRLRRVD